MDNCSLRNIMITSVNFTISDQYMSHFSLLPSQSIEAALCERLESIRLSKNISQSTLAENAGVSRRTISRMENGQGISLNTFIRILRALDLTSHLETLLPDPEILPIERVKQKGQPRRRASRPRNDSESHEKWEWGDS